MSESTKAETGTTAQQDHTAKTVTAQVADVYLGPGEGFPAELAELSLIEVQVLHSRVSSQLDWEYCLDPDGPHPVTLDRHQELVAELDTRCAELSQMSTLE